MFFVKPDKDQIGSFKGSPPPILHLSGYGDNMFNRVPVVVNSFNVELRSGIDYISTRQDFVGFQQKSQNPSLRTGTENVNNPFDANSFDQTWAPSLSNISVLITPVYSRDSIKNFNLREFSQGKLNGTDGGIGFI